MSLIRLHLGSDKKRIPGFVNVDIRPEVNPDIVANVLKLPQVRADSVAEIYYCHGLEHLKYRDVPIALREWKRILVPGGILRLSIPDMSILCWMVSQANVPLKTVRGAISGGQEYDDNIHYSVWDFDTLHETLQQGGFAGTKVYNARQWLEQVFGGPLRDVRTGKWRYFDWSIGVIADHNISLNVVARG